MLENLKEKVCRANIELNKKGLVIYTWGNVSEIDRETNRVVIKPSGVSYDDMKPEDMVVVDLLTGEKVEGKWKPSSDTKTHLELYRKYNNIGGIVHTHSINATAFAQAGRNIKALGTTHADYFHGDILCTRSLTKEEVEGDYEANTGKVIIETLENNHINPIDIPAILVKNHGPFTFGKDGDDAVYHAYVLETIAQMNLKTELLNKDAYLEQYILDKHYSRKNGPNSYYGQKKN